MDLASIIRSTAARYNVPPELMLRIAQIESGMNPAASNPSSSARGVYQFLTKPGGSWDTYGRGQNPLDPHANVDAGARYIKDNMDALRGKLGREPAPWEVYLTHQQGSGGGPALLQNPGRPAAEVLGAFYKNPNVARDAIALNGGNPDAPAQAFLDQWKAKYEGSAVPGANGGGPGAPAVDPVVPASAAGVTNPMATGFSQQQMLGSIFADALAPKPPADPALQVRKPKSVGNIIGDLGAPVQLSA